jgi:hypothetical protein
MEVPYLGSLINMIESHDSHLNFLENVNPVSDTDLIRQVIRINSIPVNLNRSTTVLEVQVVFFPSDRFTIFS